MCVFVWKSLNVYNIALHIQPIIDAFTAFRNFSLSSSLFLLAFCNHGCSAPLNRCNHLAVCSSRLLPQRTLLCTILVEDDVDNRENNVYFLNSYFSQFSFSSFSFLAISFFLFSFHYFHSQRYHHLMVYFFYR